MKAQVTPIAKTQVVHIPDSWYGVFDKNELCIALFMSGVQAETYISHTFHRTDVMAPFTVKAVELKQ